MLKGIKTRTQYRTPTNQLLACGSRAAAEVGWLAAIDLSLCRARAHCCAHSALHLAWLPTTLQEYSCSVVYQKLFHVFHPPPLPFNKSTLCYAAVYFLQLELGLVPDHVTPTMAAWQPHLGAREDLEPLESNLEGC